MSGNSIPPPAQAADAISEPKELIERLVGVLRESGRADGDAPQLLARLSQSLAHRFDREETEYEDTILRAPWLTAAVRQLREQHEQLLETLEGLSRALPPNDATPWPRDLEHRVHRRHPARARRRGL